MSEWILKNIQNVQSLYTTGLVEMSVFFVHLFLKHPVYLMLNMKTIFSLFITIPLLINTAIENSGLFECW